MAEIITHDTEVEKIAKAKKQIRAIREARTEHERTWLVNIAFLHGRQYFLVDKKPSLTSDDRILWELKEENRKDKIRRTSNYILPLFRSLLSRMVRLKTTITCDATTNDDKDKSAARVAREALEDFWQNVNKGSGYMARRYGTGMFNLIYRKTVYQLTTGSAFLVPYYNPKAVGKAYLDGQFMDGDIGAVEVKVFSPFNVYEVGDGSVVYLREPMSVDRVKEEYGVDVKPVKDESEDAERRLSSLLDGMGEQNQDDEDSANVYTKFCLPSKKYPNGQMMVFSDDKILLEEDLPEEFRRRLPVFDFKYLDFGFSKYPQSAVEQAVPIQEDLNYTLNRIADYKKKFAGKLLVPRGAKVSSEWTEEDGQIIQYNPGMTPKYEPGMSPPQYFFEDIERCRRDMEDVMSVHDSSLGKAPSGVKSGVGIQSLTELDDGQIAPITIGDEQQLSSFAEMVVEIMQRRYDYRRFIAITGENLRAEVNAFYGQDLFGNYRVRISMGSTLPINKSERQAFIMNLKREGIINLAQTKELLEFGDIEGIFTNIDEQQEKEEIQKFLRGRLHPIAGPDGMPAVNPMTGQPQMDWVGDFNLVAEPWEDHTIRLKVIHDFMKTPEYSALPPEARAKLIKHEVEHQTFLSQEVQAASRMTGAPQMPPSPQVSQK